MEAGNAIVLISSLLNYLDYPVADPSSITISIKDPSGTDLITDASMQEIETGIYKNGFLYIWQSLTSSAKGTYSAIIKASAGGYNAIETIPTAFTLE